MDIYVECTAYGLKPLYESDLDNKRKLKIGERYRVTVTRPRNYQFFQKFMALMNMTLQNQDKYDTMDQLLIEVKLKVGHYDLHVTTKGKPIYIPKSISFANMDEDKFQEFYNSALDVVLKHFLKHFSPEDVDKNLSSFM